MRDYPIVPNVFRVASSHSVDTDCASSSGCDIKITSGTNANLPTTGQLRQQQQQQQQQQKQNGNISGQQQSLVKSSISSQTPLTTIIQTTATAKKLSSQTTTTTTTKPATTTAATTTAVTTISSPSSSSLQQQNEQKNKNDVDFIMHNHNSLQKHHQQQHHQQQQQQSQHRHKLTTHASIERPQCLRSSQLHLNSPYATLPRNTGTFNGNLPFLTNYDLAIGEQLSNTNNNHANNSNIQTIENNQSNINDPAQKMLGVINTISGSIPATGYNMDHQRSTTTTNALNGGMMGLSSMNNGQRTISMGSDLNVGMNNSCTNLSKLNGIQQKQQQQQRHQDKQHKQQQQHQQQQQQHRQQQSSTLQQRDFKQTATTLADYTPYRRPHPCSSIERNTNGYLWIITPVAASISVAIVIAALAGPQWLFTEEKLPNTMYNGTANFNVLDDGAFITRYTKSSLWIICTTLQGVETYSCIKIDYFSEKGYQPDPHDSASAIPYTVTKSCPFFLASGIVLLLSFIVFLIPTCSHQNNLYYFSAGIMFIVSGLLMLIGLIAYISILKAEIGSKLRPRSTLQPPMFKVTYGQSFFLFVFGFIATEFVGLLNIFLYISLQEVGYYSRLPCFTISNLQEKIKEGENRYNTHTYKSYKHEIERKPLDKIRNQQNRKHQVTAQELELDTKKLLKNMSQSKDKNAGQEGGGGRDGHSASTNACRKHPNGMGPNMILSEMERRYYFEKPTNSSAQNKCNLHSKNLTKSLNELYTESSSSSSMLPPPPPPSAIKAGVGRSGLQLQAQTLPRPPQQFSDSPQEFPLTRSVSTTTEIYAAQNLSISGAVTKTDYSNNRRRNVATNTRYNTDTHTQTNGGSGGGNNNSQQRNNLNIHSKKTIHQQQQHDNIYNKNYATTCANTINGNVVGNNNHENVVDDGVDDNDDVDDDDEDEPTQKLCGLKRSIRKTKDELFEEFCKRAGVRPKPKNIYYIPNDDDDDDDDHQPVPHNDDNKTLTAAQQQSLDIDDEEVMLHKPLRLNNIRTGGGNMQQQRHSTTPGNHHQLQQHHGNMGDYGATSNAMENNRIFGETMDVVDIDEDVDENGFKKMTENEDHLYVIDDNIHLMPQAIRSGRRASMYVEPNHLRRLNSNLSLHAIYAPAGQRALQKSLYDLDTTSSRDIGFITTHQQQQQQPHYTLRDTYGGSQQRLHHDYQHHQLQQQHPTNQPMYQSRTLPRTFLKRNADSQDSIVSAGINASATQLHNIYSASQQRLTTLMMQQQQQQQQLQQQNRYLSMSREQEIYNSRYGLHKSNEELNRHYMQQQQQPIYIQPHHLQYQQHPTIATTNYTTAATANALKQPSLVQWPAAIPSSPSNYSGNFRMYGPATNNTPNSNHPLLARSQSGSGGGGVLATGGQQVVVNGGGSTASSTQVPSKFQRAYAFDEQRRSSNIVADAFDLDEIERERRRSHASLFTGLAVNASVNTNGGGISTGGGGGGGSGAGSTNKNHEQYDMINGTAV